MTERETVTQRQSPDPQPDSELPPPSIDGESVYPEQPQAPAVIGSTEPTAIGTLADAPPVAGIGGASTAGNGKVRIGDRVFQALTTGAGAFIVLLVLLIGIFLVYQAVPSIKDDQVNFLTSREWNVSAGSLRFGIAGLLWTTVIISVIAMIIAVPISIGIALFMTQYAPKKLAQPIAYVIDLLAAIPSIIYGIWGITVLAPKLEPVQKALYHLGGFPIFQDRTNLRSSIFDGGVVLAIMILPIITAVSRDVFARTPRANIEAAWALGATRWEMIRMAVLPYGRAGVVSGAMLGLGRALGETIAILVIVSSLPNGAPFHVSIFDGGQTFASKIAADQPEFPGNPGPYIAAGLVLFILTFIVNGAARAIVNRKKDFS